VDCAALDPGVRRILFVANGHGENAIAARIAQALRETSREPLELGLLSLVGDGAGAGVAGGPELVGPRRTMPSGGLVAMGNVRAFARDLGAGFVPLFAAQCRFLATAARAYDTLVAVGDVYALGLALCARRPTLVVGTAKSVYVAPYGRFERVLLRRAGRIFVRDEPTALALQARGVAAEAPGNVIVDLIDEGSAALPGEWLAVLPGSRETAYGDGVRLARAARALAALRPGLGALFSVAPALDAERFARELARDGWLIAPSESGPAGGSGAAEEARANGVAFEAHAGGARLVAWRGAYGALLRASLAVLGQAGTANEQAAAFGLPVVALGGPAPGGDWYRMRQRRLLGDALLLVPPEPERAAAALDGLLRDPERVALMARTGRSRMGAPGGADTIARAVLAVGAPAAAPSA
jgi:uncharacterized protein (TIGR03492 family)